MPRVVCLAFAALLLITVPACTISHEPCGLVVRPADWHFTNGTYRPWNDINSGTLAAPAGAYWGNPWGYGYYLGGSSPTAGSSMATGLPSGYPGSYQQMP